MFAGHTRQGSAELDVAHENRHRPDGHTHAGHERIGIDGEHPALWPRCRIIFLTGYSDFNYAYQAIQMSNVRYLLKTEGFDKVMEVVKDVIDEIESGNRMNEWLKQSRMQIEALEWMEQGSTSGNS